MKITEVLTTEKLQDDAHLYVAQQELQEDGTYKDSFRRVPVEAVASVLLKNTVLTTEQELTEEQKAQVRKNIGVGTAGGISVTDDGAGNVEITASGSVSITDDGNGNVTIE